MSIDIHQTALHMKCSAVWRLDINRINFLKHFTGIGDYTIIYEIIN